MSDLDPGIGQAEGFELSLLTRVGISQRRKDRSFLNPDGDLPRPAGRERVTSDRETVSCRGLRGFLRRGSKGSNQIKRQGKSAVLQVWGSQR